LRAGCDRPRGGACRAGRDGDGASRPRRGDAAPCKLEAPPRSAGYLAPVPGGASRRHSRGAWSLPAVSPLFPPPLAGAGRRRATELRKKGRAGFLSPGWRWLVGSRLRAPLPDVTREDLLWQLSYRPSLAESPITLHLTRRTGVPSNARRAQYPGEYA